MKNLLQTILTLIVAVFIVGTASCNTVDGLGKDIETGGRKIQNATED